MKRQFIATTAGVVLASLVAVSVAWADTPERLTAAADTVQSLLKIPETDKGIPQDLIKKAQCLVVVPSLKSAALGVGGEYGRGSSRAGRAAVGLRRRPSRWKAGALAFRSAAARRKS